MIFPDIVEDACDTIDAAMFTGDTFEDAGNRKILRDWIARWEREMKRFDNSKEEEDETT